MRPISTKTHGILDYVSSATLFVLPRALHWDKSLTTAVTGVALNTLSVSAMTRYEAGLLKVIPMKTHLALDCVTGISLATLPFLFLDADNRKPGTIGTLLGLGAFEIAAAFLTQTRSSIEQPEQVADKNLLKRLDNMRKQGLKEVFAH
ncbi:hypothetical protein KSC_097480 [Ktedonobacter sp. SOSP1-52]|uniref:hypothetical protein n=1 Tax=Ktedonobacter sp. SOSP1-52 TaxID=2778366 RepID=UPI0019165B0E|nr:hypothetical protein [Ktedonobacter sp. SOSP1-52]GHO70856.1 hypothetical protein KSC_097480 [Ktedonobacter sp. SOSP1-52]